MPDILRSAFHHLAASVMPTEPCEPAPYQMAVAEALLSGRRVVLRAPAGSGKTLAAWFPWLAARQQSHDFPTKLLHIMPGGSLFGDLELRLRALADTVPGLRVGIQTEGDAFDPFLLADATITTVDEMLSVALHRPLGLHPGLSNLNAAALFGAYLVFDEFPALASREALVLWLGLLRRYYPTTPCLFTTTTLPGALARRMAELLDAEYLDVSDHTAGGRRVWASQRTLGAEAILRLHRKRTIVICDSVRGAQRLYRTLRRAQPQDNAPDALLLLHQHQFYRDRQSLEARAAQYFTRQGAGSALLVTTPGIEIGADLSADTVITDPAAPDALVRRAGRCARHAGDDGRVIVAQLTDLPPNPRYPAPPAKALLERLADGSWKSFADELAALDAVWDAAVPAQLPAALQALPEADEVDDAPRRIFTGAAPLPDGLFPRVGVCLHMVPETVSDPFELERFSLAVSSLERGWRQWQAGGCHGEWFALLPQWSADDSHTPVWSLVEHPRQFTTAARLIVLNSDAVSYDPVIGLELTPGAPYQSERLAVQHTTWSPFDQSVQRYTEHAARALAAFDLLAPWHRYVLRHLGTHWRIPTVELEQWLRLCILWHDAGKLTAAWQQAAHRWQTESVRRPMQGVLARVDYQARRDGPYPCPDHAPLSGRVLARSLGVLLGTRRALLQGTLAALSHHHGLAAVTDGRLDPHPEGWPTLIELAAPILEERQLRRLDRAGWTATQRGQAAIALEPPADPDAWIAYSLLVRAIRLSDREVVLDELLGR